MNIRCLGPLRAFDAGHECALGGPKQRLVLAQLLVRATQVVPVDVLVAGVWGDDPPKAARSSLHGYVSHLRKALGAQRIEGRGQGYALRVEPDEVDRVQFEALAARGRRMRATDPAGAAEVLRAALDLWQGPPFADLADAPSLQPEIARLEELRSATTEERVGADLDCGRARELIGELEALTGTYPLRERLWEQLIVALYRSGRQGDALAAFQRAQATLADELGIDPSPELQTLHQRVLRQDPSLHAGGPVLKGYRLLERVGEGPFGVLWRAAQPGVDREVAVKTARPALANQPGFVRRFEVEAQRVARIEHPHVVPLYDFWREPDGAYLVVRYFRGGSLGDLYERSKPPDPASALRIADHVVQALAAAHRLGVVHGNLKPSNVLLDDDGNAFLSDFAIARDATPSGLAARSTDLRYLPPEGINGAQPDERADVYAMGLLLSQLLPETDGAAEVVRRATARDAAQRPRDAVALLTELRAAVAAATAPPSADRATPDVAAPDRRNPYKGLRAFTEGDAADYFGREAAVARLLARLRDPGPEGRFLAVVGPSGSGKSSVVQAGLVPALRAGALPASHAWYIARMAPGRRPFDELSSALRRVAVDPPAALAERLADDAALGLEEVVAGILPDDGELLLIVDQFEELFTHVTDDRHRQRFIDELVAAVIAATGRLRVVVTLRADFYDRPLAYGGLAELMRARTEAIVPLTPEELERAVTGPAERVGVQVERALVGQLIADVAEQPGGLPLLQYALTELFDNRRDTTLSAAAYQQIGGVAGALARRAEAVFVALSDDDGEAARQLFLQLVTLGEGLEDTRRRVGLADLVALAPQRMPTVLDGFGAARLLTFDRDPATRAPTVVVAHEALLRAWPRLRGWIDAARDDLRTQRRLQSAAADWVAADRDPSFLAAGSLLARYTAWRAESGLVASELERDYVDASLAHRARAQAEEEARQERERQLERRSVHRLRVLVGVLAVAALLAGGLTVYAVTQARRATGQTLRAEREASVAGARELSAAAVANLDVDPERSILLARAAVDRTRSVDGSVLPEAEEALHRSVTASRIVRTIADQGGSLDWSPDGAVFVTEGPEDSGIVDVRDAGTGASIRSWHGHDIDVNDVTFSSDGAMLATAGDDGALRIWDPDSGEQLHTLRGPSDRAEVWGPSFSPDSARVAAAWYDEGVVRIWDLPSGRIAKTIRSPDGPNGATFSPDGRRIAVPSVMRPATTVIDARTGERVYAVGRAQDRGYLEAAWSPDGRWLATGSLDLNGTVRVWDAHTGKLRHTLHGHTGPAAAVGWSVDATRLVTGSGDGTAKVWRLTTTGAEELVTLGAQGMSSGVASVVFSPDGRQVMTGAFDISAVQIWDASDNGDAEWANLPVPPTLTAIAFTPDDRVAIGDSDGAVGIWNVQTGERVLTTTARENVRNTADNRFSPGVSAVAVSPDGRLIASSGSGDPPVVVSDAATGRRVVALYPAIPPGWMGWSPNGRLLAVGGGSVTTIVDRSGRRVATLRDEPGAEILGAAFSPDGRQVATLRNPAGRTGPNPVGLQLWDWRRPQVLRSIRTDASNVSFEPSGNRLVVGNDHGPAEIWDSHSGRRLMTLHGHPAADWDAKYSPDGSVIATASPDSTVRLWDAKTGTQRLVLRGHRGIVGGIEFNRDGTKLASLGTDQVRVWALDLDDLIAIAKRNVTRTFTDDECRQYLHLDHCPTG